MRTFYLPTKIANSFSRVILLLLLAFASQQLFSQVVTTNTQSTHDGFFYSFWTENPNNGASMTLGPGGNYSTTWNNTLNFTAGKGWQVGTPDRVVCFEGTYDGGSNGFLALYGWTKDPLIEYYVCEKHGAWEPPGNTSDVEYKGTYTSDGGTYKMYTGLRVDKPSIVGTATFQQYWSVRVEQRSSGTITFANHVDAWEKTGGMKMGTTWDYQIMESEGYNSSGSSNITVSECTPSGPTVRLTAPATNVTTAAPATVALEATASTTNGSITKVEFFNGTTLLSSKTSAPYTYNWSNVAAGTYTISAVATDNIGEKATSTEITVTVIEPYNIYKTTTPITIDGSIDAIWNNASVAPASATKLLTGTVTNSADLSGEFKALWDNTYLYILADVNDDTKINDSENVYEDDDIEVYIDIDNDKATTYGTNDFQYSFGWDDGTTVGVIPSTGATTGITYSAVAKTGGYIVEARIPWTTVQGTPTVGQILGIDFMINDDDDAGTRDAKLSWNSATDMAYQDASLFGIGQLMDALTPCTPPTEPTVISPVLYSKNETATALTATGTSLQWYTLETGGIASSTAPIPVTSIVGTTNYYVTQTVNACESSRALIVVNITDVTQTISLHKGWNLIGCPLDGNTAIETALASIWSEVEQVKSMDAFYSINNVPELNSLLTLGWGKGYLIKVSNDCELSW